LGVLAGPIAALGEGFNNFIDGVGELFENLINSLGTWFEDLGQWFDNLVNNLEQWFTNLGNDVGTWFQGVQDNITQFAENFSNTMSNIISYLDPTSEDFFLMVALVPSEGFMQEYVTDIKEMFDGKFTFFNQIRDFLGNLFDAVVDPDPNPPEFEINLPGGKWGQSKVQIIDFSLFARYRPFILNFFRVLLWIPFLMKLYRRLPELIYQ